MSDESTLLETQLEIADMMRDLSGKVIRVYDKYTVGKSIPRLPDLKELRSVSRRYQISRELTECIDELMDIKLRVGMLYRNLSPYQNFQPPSKVDYNTVQRFKVTLKGYLEELDQYKFEISDLIKNANNKLRVLESVGFNDI